MHKLPAILSALALAATVPLAAAPPWLELDRPQPYCERRIALDVSNDYFFEIANEVPGQTEYNALISLYRKKYWGELDRAIAVFQKTFEHSPLREATMFLSVQSKFARATVKDDAAAKAAEKGLRDALLLYPKSKLAPVAANAAGDFWLRAGQFERAMAMFRNALELYPADPLACVFKLGVAETMFQLHDWDASRDNLRALLGECRNFRLRTAALLRLAEIPLFQGKSVSETELEKILETDGGYVERFHPGVFFNLGEIQYAKKNYTESRFYFGQYVKNESKDGACIQAALERQADIAMRLGEPMEKIAGLYLMVREAAPSTDLGRFAYVHTLLLTMDGVKKPEFDRRLRVIDENIEKISDEKLKRRAFLEKGLATLQWGEKGALTFLASYRKAAHASLDGEIGAYIRKRVREFSEEEIKAKAGEDDPLEVFERRYSDWLRGTPDEEWAHAFYTRALTGRALDKWQAGDRAGALALLDHWRATALWREKEVSPEIRDRLAAAVLADLTQTDAAKTREAALFYVERAESLRPFQKGLELVPALTAYFAGDPRPLRAQQFPKTLSKELLPATRSRLWLALARAERKEKRYGTAEAALKNVDGEALRSTRLYELIGVYRDAGKLARALETAETRFKLLGAGERPAALSDMASLVREGKMWAKSGELLKLSEKNGLQGKALAPFCYLAGRGAFEKTKCDDSIRQYRRALELDSAASDVPEARYRLGKCLLKQKKMQAAREEFDKLIQLKDEFWSPLARNEMKLLP